MTSGEFDDTQNPPTTDLTADELYDKAERAYSVAISTLEKHANGDWRELVATRVLLAELHHKHGQTDREDHQLDRARALQAQRREGGHDAFESLLIELGNSRVDRGITDDALAIFHVANRLVEPLGDDQVDLKIKAYYGLGRALAIALRYADAVELLTKSLALSREYELVEFIATNADTLGSVKSTLGDYTTAESLLTESLTIRRSTLEETDPKIISSLNNLAILRGRKGDNQGAAEAFVEAIDLIETIEKPSDETLVLLGKLYHNLADTQISLQQNVEAEVSVVSALRTWANVLGPEDPYVNAAHAMMGTVLRTLGRFGEAELYLQDAISSLSAIVGDESATLAILHEKLGEIYESVGNFGAARDTYFRALEITEQAYGAAHLQVGRKHYDLARLHYEMMDLSAALDHANRSLEVFQANLDSADTRIAFVLNMVAGIQKDIGNWQESLLAQKKSIELLDSAGGSEIFSAMLVHNLANLYRDLGNYDEADTLYTEAMDRLAAAGNNNPLYDASVLANHGILFSRTSKLAEAESIFTTALDLQTSAYGTDLHPEAAGTMLNLADTLRQLKRFEQAEDIFRRCIEIGTAVFGEDHQFTISSRIQLAGSLSESGAPDAIDELETALDAAVATASYPETSVILNQFASAAYANLGQPELGILYGKRAVNLIQELRTNAQRLNPDLQSDFLASKEDVYRQLAQLLIFEGRLGEAQQVLSMLKEEEYFDYIRRQSDTGASLNTRAAYTQSEESWSSRYQEIKDQLAEIGEELAVLKERQRVEKALGKSLGDSELDRLSVLESDRVVARTAFRTYRSELTDYFAQLSGERAIEFGRKDLDSLSAFESELRRIETATGERIVLLTYLVTDSKLHIILTTPNITLSRSTDLAAAALNVRIQALLEVLQDPKVDPLAAAKDLYDSVIGPVAEDLAQANADMLVVSLDGALRYVPISVLHDGTSYLAERYAVSVFTPAARSTLNLAPNPSWRVAALGVTNPGIGYQPLPGVKHELDQIVNEESEVGGAETGVLNGEIWLNQAFTADALSGAMDSGYPVIHIASHFVFKPGTEDHSYLLLGDGSELTLEEFVTGSYSFDQVDLLTLSACQTALGASNANGREFEGFGARAQNQGAKAVLATLWPVADASTAEFMTRFYDYRQNGEMSKAQALKAVQHDYMAGEPTLQINVMAARGLTADNPSSAGNRAGSDLRHPYYWAPFILMGNWQ